MTPAPMGGSHSDGTAPGAVGSSAAPPDPGSLSSAAVVDPQGRRLGRVHDVFLVDRTGEVAALSVAIGRWGGRIAVAPASRFRPAGSGRLVYDPADGPLEDAPDAPATGHLTGEELAALDAAATSDAGWGS